MTVAHSGSSVTAMGLFPGVSIRVGSHISLGPPVYASLSLKGTHPIRHKLQPRGCLSTPSYPFSNLPGPRGRADPTSWLVLTRSIPVDFLGAQMVKGICLCRRPGSQSLAQEDPLSRNATHPSIFLLQRTPWMQQPAGC